MSATDTIENAVRRASEPSQLKITDIRVATIQAQGIHPILKIDTNQGVSGLGEVRDAGHAIRLAVQVDAAGAEPLQRRVFVSACATQFGNWGREGGGVSGVEIALMDLVGKAYGVPCYQLLGGKYRDRVRLYGDTPTPDDPTPDEFAEVADAATWA